jgi:hypothetical protein
MNRSPRRGLTKVPFADRAHEGVVLTGMTNSLVNVSLKYYLSLWYMYHSFENQFKILYDGILPARTTSKVQTSLVRYSKIIKTLVYGVPTWPIDAGH